MADFPARVDVAVPAAIKQTGPIRVVNVSGVDNLRRVMSLLVVDDEYDEC